MPLCVTHISGDVLDFFVSLFGAEVLTSVVVVETFWNDVSDEFVTNCWSASMMLLSFV